MKYFCICVFVLLASVLFAQDNKPFESAVPRQAIRFSPLHLMSFYPTLQVGYEQGVYRRFTFYSEIGVVLDYNNSAYYNGDGTYDYKDKRGFKVKLEPRFYFWENKNNLTFYGAVEFYSNYVNFDRRQNRVECYDADCINRYQRIEKYVVKYREIGFAPKIGMQLYIKNFFIDVNSGLAFRNINYVKPESPGIEDTFVEMFSIRPIEEKRKVLGPVLCVRLGHRFK